ncbi:hypothetical protein Pcinc_035227, partial [Petrolisthes cinctipes]
RDQDQVKQTNTHTHIKVNFDGSEPEVHKNKELMKKIPEGAEAIAVLVGAVDFLKHLTIAFVRLAEGVKMETLVEVPIPVVFMFVLLGAFHGETDYHEPSQPQQEQGGKTMEGRGAPRSATPS